MASRSRVRFAHAVCHEPQPLLSGSRKMAWELLRDWNSQLSTKQLLSHVAIGLGVAHLLVAHAIGFEYDAAW